MKKLITLLLVAFSMIALAQEKQIVKEIVFDQGQYLDVERSFNDCKVCYIYPQKNQSIKLQFDIMTDRVYASRKIYTREWLSRTKIHSDRSTRNR